MKRVWYFPILLLFVVVSCSRTGEQKVQRERYTISYDQIQLQPQADTAWDLVINIRPDLLDRDKRRWVGFNKGLDALCYLDGTPFGSKEDLRKIRASNVFKIEYVDGFEANARYGPTAAGGIFFVISHE